MKQVLLRQVDEGEFFRLTASDTAPVWVRGHYEPSEKKYEAYKHDDTNHESFFKGDRTVFVDFEF